MSKHTLYDLQELQALPLYLKIRLTKQRIREWVNRYGEDGVYVSFSGGKDSTVLLHLVREEYPDVPAVFIDTGLEYPEIREFVKTFENVIWLKPKKNFRQIIQDYGYPVISKDVSQCCFDVATQARLADIDKRKTTMWNRVFNPESDYAKKYPGFTRAKYDWLNDAPFKISHMCCNVLKKSPSKQYEKENDKHPIIATMAAESRLRRTQWIVNGCNAFDAKRPISKPMSFWNEQDVLIYIYINNIQISSIYGDIVNKDEDGMLYSTSFCDLPMETTGASRTGCMFCMFGCTAKKYKNIEILKTTHPKIYEYIMKSWDAGGLGYKEVIDWLNENGDLHINY